MQRYLDYGSLPGGRTRVKNSEVGSGDGGGGGCACTVGRQSVSIWCWHACNWPWLIGTHLPLLSSPTISHQVYGWEKNLRFGLNLMIDIILHAKSEEETGRFRASLPWHFNSTLHPGEGSKSQLTCQSQADQNTRGMKPSYAGCSFGRNHIQMHDTIYINVLC